MNRDLYSLAISFNDEPNVYHYVKFLMDAKGVPLSLDMQHPRTGQVTKIVYRGTSTRGSRLYFFREGTSVGEVRGG